MSPGADTSAVDRLAEAGVIPTEFAVRFRPVAGFRDVLVHAYLDVDLDRVHDVLNHRLGESEAYASSVRAWLDARAPG